jgi:hypothetical protein
VRFDAIIVSCPQREEVRARTLASLGQSDWTGNVSVTVDDGDNSIPVLLRIGQTWRRAVAEAAESTADCLLLMEDDVEVCRCIRHNLETWKPIVAMRARGGINYHFYGSLYDPGILPFRCKLKDHYFYAFPQLVWGAQAVLVSPETARLLIAKWQTRDEEPDRKMPRIAARATPIFYHSPSLVEHIGDVSTWGGVMHRARSYDRDWQRTARQV